MQCHTNRDSCCTSVQGIDRGNWYYPNGSRLNFSRYGDDIYQSRGAQRVDLLRRNNASINGIFYCNISTHYYGANMRIYMGLYTNGGQFYIIIIIIIIYLCSIVILQYVFQGILPYKIILCSLRSLTSMDPVLGSPSPVSPLGDLLPTSLGPETLTLSLKELRLC